MDQLLQVIRSAVAEKKGHDPVVLDLKGISGITDYFLICSAQSSVQLRAIADYIYDQVTAAAIALPFKEGYQEGRWILLDFGSLVVHIMLQEERDFYSLENLWHDARKLPDDFS